MACTQVLNMKALMGMSEECVGKMRIRVSTLTPNKAHCVTLPLHGERAAGSGSPAGITSRCHMTVMLLLPTGAAALGRYLQSYLNPAESRTTTLLKIGAVPGSLGSMPETDPAMALSPELISRRVRHVAHRWLAGSSPPISTKAARKVVDDGTQDFSLARTQLNWKRIGAALKVVEPLSAMRVKVQSWSDPVLSTITVLAILLFAASPAKVLAAGMAASVLYMCLVKAPSMGPALGCPPAMMEDSEADAAYSPEASTNSNSAQTDADDDVLETSSLSGGSGPQGANNAGSATGRAWSVGTSAVPLDPLSALRQQYGNAARMMIGVQNALDGVACTVERLQALGSWTDPVATGIFCVLLLLLAVLFWFCGVRALVAVALLWDVRPPSLQDPWIPPPDVFMGAMPTRSDLMM
ncbi:MAG: hypothetical protein WDW36_009377 [Sanguina aurantia]